MSVQCLCPRPADLSLRRFEDGVVVYDEADGSLRALSPFAGELLSLLVEQAGSARASLEGDGWCGMSDTALVRELLMEEPEPADLEAVRGVLQELASLGFVEYPAA